MKITSRDNSLLRRARSVRDGKEIDSIYIEGLRLCEEALASSLTIEAVIYSEELGRKERAAKLIQGLTGATNNVASVSEKLLASISYTKTPQGILVLASRPAHDEISFKKRQAATPLIVVMLGINNPVNVGAILRVAEAAGATGVIATQNTADPFSPKGLRGAMGSAFRLPIWEDADYPKVVDWCQSSGIKLLAADVNASTTHVDVSWKDPCALILGPESTGLTPAQIQDADQTIKVPMQGEVESLNVAVAAGVILYEAARQRKWIQLPDSTE
ncbi:MAG: RNA methyltransferase [Acidobacteriota bacterium]